MSNNKVKVTGYAKRVFFDGGIEYRNFSPDLVGVQLASDGGTPLFTMGNFSITTNMEPKSDKTFITNKFSNFISLTDLDLTVEQTNVLLTDNAEVNLNLDKRNINYYALFGSLTEFVRVGLEDIITKWPASLYLTPIAQTPEGVPINGYTFEDYTYDALTEISTFKVDTNFITNNFQLNYLKNGIIIDSFSSTNDLRNLSVNYQSYVILNNGIEYPVIDFIGATKLKYDYIYFTVKGNPFSGLGVSSKVSYHIKPSNLKAEEFFNALPDFESYLLNRNATPLYTSVFKYPITSDNGVVLYITETLTWPVSDGYNIDFDTSLYTNYATKLLEISNTNDLISSNLMTRFLVTESISDFDTTPVHLGPMDQDTSGQKMNKALHVYGVEFDKINNFISGIAFAHTVSYDKQDNTPDVYLKDLAKVLGWELMSSVLENNLLANYVTTAPSTYSGQSVGLTAVDADTELWRRLILNTPWIWKSKGARKSVEFLIKFIGAPLGLVQFNEYIYKATAPIDIELFKSALELNGLDTDISLYPIDSNGYPSPLPDTPDMYFQNNGLWYRQTGGTGATTDILTGNNPHVGPYDGGYKYINQFATLIPGFSAVTISSSTTTQGSVNLFTNYNLGGITNYTGQTYVDGMFEDGSSLSDCVVITTTIVPDMNGTFYINECGCTCEADDDDSLSICVDINENIVKTETSTPCSPSLTSQPKINEELGVYLFAYEQYDINGNPTQNVNQSYFTNPACCSTLNGIPWLYDQTKNTETGIVVINSGYVCCTSGGGCGCVLACKWALNEQPTILYPNTHTGPDFQYLQFTNEANQPVVVTPDGCNCIVNLTIPVPNIVDPNTGQIGYGCKLTEAGIADLNLGTSGVIYQTYDLRKKGEIRCNSVYDNTKN
jgi:hypothetical protein